MGSSKSSMKPIFPADYCMFCGEELTKENTVRVYWQAAQKWVTCCIKCELNLDTGDES